MRFYYHLKPYLPWRLRITLRSLVARRQQKLFASTWPINEAAGGTPKDWPGWPDGKKSALVIMHDVEGPRGLAKCPQLLDMEKRLGFRSAFNFIPEGGYRVPAEMRRELAQNGYEVGVHDLRHDGKLYWSREIFAANARRINHYVKEWGAKGFRSGFMFHQLEWLHDLNVQYDASTFDTDPFEPQPDAANTIFPFWVDGKNGHSYVEIPYTLPQDSTLFLVLKEKTIDIWKKKIDWLVQRGGMLVLAVHPDYLSFDAVTRHRDEYPATWYEEVLTYIKGKYAGVYWHGTPGELADWYRKATRPNQAARVEAVQLAPALQGKRAVVALYSYYPADPRPRRAAEALVKAGMEVDMLCLRQQEDEPTFETINGVNVRRLPIRRRRDSKLTYIFQYGSFIGLSTMIQAWRSLWKKYDLVHVHTMPDVLVFSALVPKLRGARVMLDLHDPMPELMMTIFGLGEESSAIKLLKSLEKWSMAFAHHVITVNRACKNIFAARSCPAEKIQVVMNVPDEKIFLFQAFQGVKTRNPELPFKIMYHGSIVERHGLDLAVRAVKMLAKEIPLIDLRIYGARTPFLDEVMKLVAQEKLEDSVHYCGSKNLEQVAAAIKDCDLGIIPNRKSIFTEINTPTRIFEYLSLGRPVIAPLVPGITDYFKPDELVFFKLGDAEDLARQIKFVHANPEATRSIVDRGQSVYLRHTWSQEERNFVGKVAELLTPRR